MHSHLKKCDICGRKFEESSDLDVLIVTGPSQCPYCKEILALRKLISEYDGVNRDKEWEHETFKKNMVPCDERKLGYGYSTSYTLADHDEYFEIENRTNVINDLISRIAVVRDLLNTRIGPQFEILDSIYERKDMFWFEGGNLPYFVNDAIIQYVVIKMKEIISGSKSKYSIEKIKNIINDKKKQIYEEQKIYEVFKFHESGDIMKVKYEPFPIMKYLEKLSDVISSYQRIINAFSDLRDNVYAHIGEVKNKESYKNLNYANLKRVFNSLKIIYDGFLFSIAPDKYAYILMRSNINFSHLNILVSKGKQKEDEEEKEIEKAVSSHLGKK